MALRQIYTDKVTLDGTGAGLVQFTMRGDVLVQHTRVTVVKANGLPATLQSTAMISINGDEFEGSYSGNNDASGTAHLMLSGDILTCSWTGGDVGARATCVVRGLQYNAGDGIRAVAGALR